MKIKIRKNGGSVAVLISFDIHSDKFESNYERNKFFRGLYGWTQIIRKKSSEYKYRREGLLDEIPHIKVDNSVFIVALKEMERIMKYMEEWKDKIDYDFFKVILNEEQYKELKEMEDKIK
ncbi:MAG: hypothetical protein J7K87_01980 [Candidatus Aenigmarchaeota archaeon]|nr:hypothetical protein [Candidatus Aenigmarchaeota archaeon]